jgi:DNA-binding NtrC family response regulator
MLDQRPHILVADDESLFLLSTLELLRQVGYRCTGAANAHEALAVLGSQPVDALIADLNMPGNLQLELLHQGRERHPHVPIIVVTGVPTLHSAIDSVRLGISDYLLKPVKFDDLLASLKRVLENWHAQTTAPQPADGAAEASVRERLIGESPRIREIVEIVGRVAATDTSVLLTGESGTGKEVVAQAIHRASGRRSGPFVPIDCAAIPESLFESTLFGHARGAFTGAVADQAGLLQLCNGGTAFLDEIGEMPRCCRPSCCASSNMPPSSRSAAPKTSGSTPGSLRRPTATCRWKSSRANFGRTCFTAWGSCRSGCRRSANAGKTCCCWPSTFGSSWRR